MNARKSSPNRLTRLYFPAIEWLGEYNSHKFSADAVAGLLVAIMLIPQGMAYALLAGLPPEMGLYASILPLILYSAFGSSRTLAVGPVAIVSLMVASTLAETASGNPEQFIAGAITLAFLSGVFLLLMGIARLGFLVNFLSHPVMAGFTSAAAIVIGLSQLKHILGMPVPRSPSATDTLWFALTHLSDVNFVTFALAIAAFIVLLFWRSDSFRNGLVKVGATPGLIAPITKAGPLIAVAFTALICWIGSLDTAADVKVVGEIPTGLPPLTAPSFEFEMLRDLLPAAILISIVGFLESISVAKSLAAKRRQKVDANNELIALGAANIGASVTGGYPVTGGFSRSLVNFAAGAVTPVASIVTAICVAVAVLFFTPFLYFLPKAALAAIILFAVVNLIDFKTFTAAWLYNKADATSYLVTFLSVLTLGVEPGIAIGIALSLGLFIYRTSRPHVAIVGRVGDTEHFRNVLRHDVSTDPRILMLRIDESLYFANCSFLEELILSEVSDQRKLEHVVIIMSAVNVIDVSALDTLETIIRRLRAVGVTLHFAEIKGPVMDKLDQVDFEEKLGLGRVFLSANGAFKSLSS